MTQNDRPLIGLDTDVLVHWSMSGSPHHMPVRSFFAAVSSRFRPSFAVTQQTLTEFLHVVTDSRRFDHPIPMQVALEISRQIWSSRDIEPILPTADVYYRVCNLMEQFRLGRKRILDTALAATFEVHGIQRIATLNGRVFDIFPFLDVIDPTSSPPSV